MDAFLLEMLWVITRLSRINRAIAAVMPVRAATNILTKQVMQLKKIESITKGAS